MTVRKPSLRVTRDSVLFACGIAGIGYETLVTGGERPTLLILFAAMCGLPVFLRSDETTGRKPRAHEDTEDKGSV